MNQGIVRRYLNRQLNNHIEDERPSQAFSQENLEAMEMNKSSNR
ncbi:hypothetical protein [Companilactobacillus alimentarius]|nr:hypothetical protein [Companilactobacillus alimentarius]